MRTLTLSLLAISACANAQVVFQTIYNGPQGYAGGSAVIQTADGGYAVAGTTSGFQVFDGLLMRFNAIGDTIWSRRYDFGGYDFLTDLIELPDGGFMLGGHIAYEGLLLVRTDADGDTLWSHVYPAAPGWQQGSGMLRLPNGWIVLTGETSVDEETPSDMFRLVLDENGGFISSTNEGGPWRESAHDIAQTTNGGLVIVGEQRLHAEDSLNLAIWLYDNAFNIVATMGYGIPEAEDVPDNITAIGNAVQPCQAGGFIVAGMVTDSSSGDTDAVFIRVSQNFEFLWTVLLGDAGVDRGSGVVECENGNFSLLWWSSAGIFGTWNVTVVDQNGQELSSTAFGGPDDYASGTSITTSTDGDPVVTGILIAGGQGIGTPVMHLTKINGECFPVDEVGIDESLSAPVEAWPNPFTSCVTLRIPSAKTVSIQVTDPIGQRILQTGALSDGRFTWNCRTASGTEVLPGMYLVTVIADGQRYTQRVIKQ